MNFGNLKEMQERFMNAMAHMVAKAGADAEERRARADAERRRVEAERAAQEAAQEAARRQEEAAQRQEAARRHQRALQAVFNHLQRISSQKDDQLEATRRFDHNWRRVEHNKVVQAAQAARDSWSRLPLSLVGTLGVTLPTDPGPNLAPTNHSLSLALTGLASHFSTATILSNRRVLDDLLAMNIFRNQADDGINRMTLNYQKALFRRLGPHIEKITFGDQIALWPVFTSAILYQQQLQRLEITGLANRRCLQSLQALEKFKFSPRLPSLQQLEVDGHEWWDEAELKYFTAFFNVIAPYLRVLTLNGIYPLIAGRYQPMPNLHSLDVILDSSVCVNEFLRPRGGLLKAITLGKLQSFGLSFTYPSEDGSEDQLQKQLFTTIIGKMVNLQKLALEVIISEAFERFTAKKQSEKAQKWKMEAKAALPKLTKLRILHLKISGGSGDAGLNRITDYRYWIMLFQLHVPSISKLVFHVAVNLVRNCIQLDFNPGGSPWKKSLKSLVVNFAENTSITRASFAGAKISTLFYIPTGFHLSLFSSLTTLTITNVSILNEQALANIADCCTDLVEFNFSASGGDFYRSKKRQRSFANPMSNPQSAPKRVVINFDAIFASTIEKLKSLRALRFIDDYEKLIPQTITAMCRRAMAVAAASGQHQLLGVQKKKCLLRVPLTSAFNQEVLAIVEVKNLIDEAGNGVEIY